MRYKNELKIITKMRSKKNGVRLSFGQPLFCYLFFISLFLFLQPLYSQPTSLPATNGDQPQVIKTQPHFYNIDREITVEGQVEDLKFESRYEGRGHFLILLVKDKISGELLEVETAPAWFFKTDIHKGEKIRLIGSLAEGGNQGKKLVIAREIKINNQTIVLRDRRGFPTWSRGQGRRGPAE